MLYHGSSHDFNHFQLPNCPVNGDILGRGVYLTPDKELASRYASDTGFLYTVVCYPGIASNQPLSTEKVTLTRDTIIQLLTKITQWQIENNGYPYLISDWLEPKSETSVSKNQTIINSYAGHLMNRPNDLLIINEIQTMLNLNVNEQQWFLDILNELSITTLIDNQTNTVLVFNPKNIKINTKEKISR